MMNKQEAITEKEMKRTLPSNFQFFCQNLKKFFTIIIQTCSSIKVQHVYEDLFPAFCLSCVIKAAAHSRVQT